ncbi:MAG: GNAT family N-acetyltransferase [Clostridia bacterium]|nr:GNAT family N-acetyltransferase [Clostridia bacterium]
MVILITGATHTGKTLLASRLIEKYKFPCTSIDHLKMGLIRSGNTALTPEDDGDLTDYLWPVVREMIKTAIENRQNLIVEGCYVPYDWRKDFDETYLADIRFICLAMTDEYIDANFDKIVAHASDIEARLDDSYCTAGTIKAINRELTEGFRRSGEQVTLIDGDYEEAIETLLKRLARTIPPFTVIPHLESNRITVRKLTVSDAEGLEELAHDEAVYRYLPTFLFEQKYDDTGTVIDRLYTECLRESIIMGIFADGQFAGLIELYGHRAPIRKISVGYRLLRSFCGKGIASEALGLLIRYLYEETDTEIVTASTMVENRASANVLIKNGFSLVASAVPEDWGYEELTPADKWIR